MDRTGRARSRIPRWIRWIRWLDSPGMDVALVGTTGLAVALHSYWPPLLWLVCALGAAFDRAWRKESTK